MIARVIVSVLLVAGCGHPNKSTQPAPTQHAPTNQADSEALPVLSADAPKDRPVHSANADELAEQKRAIAPYVEQGRKTYPDAKRRYLAGLPAGHHFFVTTLLRSPGFEESVFIAVKKIEGDKITGTIASDIMSVKGYKAGDSYTFAEAELTDWMVARPDGSEEGNVVGKFLEEWAKTHR